MGRQTSTSLPLARSNSSGTIGSGPVMLKYAGIAPATPRGKSTMSIMSIAVILHRLIGFATWRHPASGNTG